MSKSEFQSLLKRLHIGEGRRLERFTLQLRAEVETLHADKVGRQTSILFTRNVSSGGAFFDTDTPLPKGERVKVKLVLKQPRLTKPSGKFAEVRLNGTVLRSESAGMAIAFDRQYRMLPSHAHEDLPHSK
jgi:hypothetical protein